MDAAGSQPTGITAGPDGALWFTEKASNKIGRLGPSNRAHDFNGDGKSDLVWRDGSGDVAFWLMNGAAVTSSGGTGGVPATWSIVGQRDFNKDGKADLLWRDTSGNTAMWFMNGTAVGSSVSVGNIPTTWSVIGTGDFNGDAIHINATRAEHLRSAAPILTPSCSPPRRTAAAPASRR
jgi:hypothetical protein